MILHCVCWECVDEPGDATLHILNPLSVTIKSFPHVFDYVGLVFQGELVVWDLGEKVVQLRRSVVDRGILHELTAVAR